MNPNFMNIKEKFIIAEIGGNHEGNFEYAKTLLKEAASSGVHAVKFQTYKGDKIVSRVSGPERNEHFKKFELTNDQWVELAETCKDLGVEFMSSVWDEDSLELLNRYINIHKIGSGDMTNYPLVKKLVETKKPIIISTAMSTLEEVEKVVEFVESVDPNLIKENKLCLLHCVAMYGDPKEEYANLGAITTMQEAFPNIHIGYSDHTIGMHACEVAVAMGCRVIEKHFTDDKTREFRDHEISADNEELREFLSRKIGVKELLLPKKSAKKPVLPVENEERIKQFRRSVCASRDLEEGSVLSEENTTTLRPNVGIDASKYFDILGRKIKNNKKAFEPIREEDLL